METHHYTTLRVATGELAGLPTGARQRTMKQHNSQIAAKRHGVGNKLLRSSGTSVLCRYESPASINGAFGLLEDPA